VWQVQKGAEKGTVKMEKETEEGEERGKTKRMLAII